MKRRGENVIRFPVENVPKIGFERAAQGRRGRQERRGQMNLFHAAGGTRVDRSGGGRVLKLPTGLGPFDEALLLDERGDEEAAAMYRRAITEEDCTADAWCNLGIMESRAGNTVQAFDCFTQSLALEPRHLESHFNLGNLYFEEGDLHLAALHYEIAVTLEPEFASAHFNLGLCRALQGDNEKAEASLRRYRTLAPEEETAKVDELLHGLRLARVPLA